MCCCRPELHKTFHDCTEPRRDKGEKQQLPTLLKPSPSHVENALKAKAESEAESQERYVVRCRGRIQRQTWRVGPYAGVDYNLPLCPESTPTYLP